jgi:hypothetical protein
LLTQQAGNTAEPDAKAEARQQSEDQSWGEEKEAFFHRSFSYQT